MNLLERAFKKALEKAKSGEHWLRPDNELLRQARKGLSKPLKRSVEIDYESTSN